MTSPLTLLADFGIAVVILGITWRCSMGARGVGVGDRHRVRSCDGTLGGAGSVYRVVGVRGGEIELEREQSS